MPNEPNTSRHLPALDGLRALAILLVIGHHLAHYIPLDGSASIFRAVAGTGWNGVYLFFVLSGFLVGGIALRELQTTGGLNLRRFWFRRLMRTWPLYFLLLAINVWRQPGSIDPPLWHYLTFTQNFFDPKFFMVTWSLAVEEQFYFFLPLVLIALWKLKRPSVSGGLLLALLIVATYLYRWIEGNGFYKFFHTFAVLDSLLIGVWLAYGYQKGKLGWGLRHPTVCTLLGLIFVYGASFTSFGRFLQTNFLYGGQAIGFGLILVAALSENFFGKRFLSHRALTGIATLSYGMYLSHDKPLYYAARMAQWLGLEGWGMVAFLVPLVLGGSVALAWVLYHAVEKPALRWRDKFSPRSRSSQRSADGNPGPGLSPLKTSAAKS